MRNRNDIEQDMIKNRQAIETIQIANFQKKITNSQIIRLKRLLIKKDDLIIELANCIKNERNFNNR